MSIMKGYRRGFCTLPEVNSLHFFETTLLARGLSGIGCISLRFVCVL